MPIDIEKPSTRKQPLRRGIHITEHKDYRINPEPLSLARSGFFTRRISIADEIGE